MTVEGFRASLSGEVPPDGLTVPLAALWWDAKGDWTLAHGLVDELETQEGMAVHAYLHRKGGEASNADYCTSGLGGSFTGRRWRMSGRRWSRDWRPEPERT